MSDTTHTPLTHASGTTANKRKAVTALTALVSLMLATSPVALSSSESNLSNTASSNSNVVFESFELTSLNNASFRAREGSPSEVSEAEVVSTTTTRVRKGEEQ